MWPIGSSALVARSSPWERATKGQTSDFIGGKARRCRVPGHGTSIAVPAASKARFVVFEGLRRVTKSGHVPTASDGASPYHHKISPPRPQVSVQFTPAITTYLNYDGAWPW